VTLFTTLTERESLTFVRGGMLFIEPPERWAVWNKRIWTDCACPSSLIIRASPCECCLKEEASHWMEWGEWLCPECARQAIEDD
jgi:acetone carboxylase gamma subunit